MIINNIRHRINRTRKVTIRVNAKPLTGSDFLAAVDIFTFLHWNKNRRKGGGGGGEGRASLIKVTFVFEFYR